MMIFVLDILLAINLWISYKFFKNLFAPPILMGSGLLAASLIATSYYESWEMASMRFLSVFIIGGGTLFFTFCCIFISRFYKPTKFKDITSLSLFFSYSRLRLFLIISLAIGIVGLLLKLYYMRLSFGNLAVGELIRYTRLTKGDYVEEDLYMPSYVRQMSTYTTIVSNFMIWLLAMMLSRINTYKLTALKGLLVANIIVVFLGTLLTGAKGHVLNVVVQFALFYLYFYYSFHRSYQISPKLLLKMCIILILLATTFRGLNEIVGGNVEGRRNSDMLAMYCGAEIKNLDIIVNRDTRHSNKWGEKTFANFYREVEHDTNKNPGEFFTVGNFDLGNVYTQYGYVYMDWGIKGVFLINIIIAIISMYFYNKSKISITNPTCINPYIFLYVIVAYSIFQTFFSSKFTEVVMTFGFLRTMIYIFVMCWFLKKFIKFS